MKFSDGRYGRCNVNLRVLDIHGYALTLDFKVFLLNHHIKNAAIYVACVLFLYYGPSSLIVRASDRLIHILGLQL